MTAELIMMIILVFLSLIGLCCIIRGLTYFLMCKGVPKSMYTIIRLGEDDDITTLKCAFEQIVHERAYISNEANSYRKIVVVDTGMSKSASRVCENMCMNNSIDFIYPNELSEWVKNQQTE